MIVARGNASDRIFLRERAVPGAVARPADVPCGALAVPVAVVGGDPRRVDGRRCAIIGRRGTPLAMLLGEFRRPVRRLGGFGTAADGCFDVVGPQLPGSTQAVLTVRATVVDAGHVLRRMVQKRALNAFLDAGLVQPLGHRRAHVMQVQVVDLRERQRFRTADPGASSGRLGRE
jgi:hypothetical protein